jgi:hypothetical protein
MRTKRFRLGAVVGSLLLIASAAQAYNITITYEGQEVLTVAEGETLTLPPFDSLDPIQQMIIEMLGYKDTYLRLEGTSLTVPTGCLEDDITVDVAEVDVPGAVVAFSFVVDGWPDGYNFSCLPELTLPYGQCLDEIEDEGALTIAFYEDGSFTTSGVSNVTVDTENDTVTANIAHMSILVLNEGGGGGEGVQMPVLTSAGLAIGIGALGLVGAAALRRRD